ncbi:MAG TPA: CaiB/BaiF CoA-transferase family protein [Actinomycetota bacterium]|nr:CaiB/BaiF CoA-transferase family protein [Actinomycetota bacterium]
MSETAAPSAGPLNGVRVLDLTRLLPGNVCTLVLADLGADVIKVEEPGKGDYIRWSPPLVAGQGAAHRAVNRGKRSLSLNLKAPGGPDLLHRLVEHADVLVESFRPGVMARLGAGYESLAARNPALVYCAITGYGQDGPYAQLAGHDINYLGYAGVLSMSGPVGSEPVLSGVQIADIGGGGLLGAVGILAALVERRATGRGRFVDTGMIDGAFAWLSIHLGTHLGGFDTAQIRGLTGDLACYRVYRAGDGKYLTVGALENQFWQALCDRLEVPELIADQYGPPERQREVAARLQEIFDTKPRDEWVERFADVPACVGPVNDLNEAMADPQVVARRMVAEVDGAPVGASSPIKFVEPDAGPVAPANLRSSPELGEHTEDVLGELLGLQPDELEALRADGTI